MDTQQMNAPVNQAMALCGENDRHIDRRLSDALETVQCAMRGNEKIIVLRFEIRIPNSYMQGFIFDGNKLVKDFIRYMKNIIRRANSQSSNSNRPVASASVDAIWQSRMVNHQGIAFRVALILSPEAYYKQHRYKMPQEVAMDRILYAWARVSSQTVSVANQQVHFPAGWVQVVESSRYGMAEIFPKISVLCSDPDGHNGVMFSGFGTTRNG